MDAYHHYLGLVRMDAAASDGDPAVIGRHLLALAICLERADDRPDPRLEETRTRIAFQLRILAHEAKRIGSDAHRLDFSLRVLEMIGLITDARDGAYFVGMEQRSNRMLSRSL
jgi:hypothetical protein